MFDVLDGTCPVVRGIANARSMLWEGPQSTRRCSETEECAAVSCHHRSHGLPGLLGTWMPFWVRAIATALRGGLDLNEYFDL
jgi:hypothetical protein